MKNLEYNETPAGVCSAVNLNLLFLCFVFLTSPLHTLLWASPNPAWKSLLGSRAPNWNNQNWINSAPLKLSELRGRVILLRFFMDSACPMCSATAPSLNYFYSKYRDRGLIVVGMYTPKPQPAEVSVSTVRKYVEAYKFEFPVALDNDWSTLKAFWLNRVSNTAFTSVSFLIDKRGVVRFVHPGGEYSADSADKNSRKDFAQIEEMIQKLIEE